MVRILSIDGGGMRGFIAASLLAKFEVKTSRPCWEQFDIIAGTSIGGILAALLSSGVPATDCLNFFTEDGPKIFKRSLLHYFGIHGARYKDGPINKALQDRMKGLKPKTRLVIPSVDLTTKRPYFFKFVPGSKQQCDLWQAARATSSAQIFFPAFSTRFDDGHHVFWDGGTVANNPSICALSESRMESTEQCCVLSIGCGTKYEQIDAEQYVNANIIKNAELTAELLFDAGSEAVDYQAKALTGGTYFRVQPELKEKLAIDDASPLGIAKLRSAALDAFNDDDLNDIMDQYLAALQVGSPVAARAAAKTAVA